MQQHSIYRHLNFSVGIIIFILVSYFFQQLASLLIPVTLGIIVGLLFTPLLVFLQKKKIPTGLIILIILGLFIFSCLIFFSIMMKAIQSISSGINPYQNQISLIISSIKERLYFVDADILSAIAENIFAYLQDNIVAFSSKILQSVSKFASQFFMVTITMVFVLFEISVLEVKIKALYENNKDSKTKGDSLSKLIININTQVSRFLLLKTIISLATAIIVYIGLGIIGVDFKFVWAVLTFFFNFIPTVGSILITVSTILFSTIQFFPNFVPVLWVSVLTLSIQMVIGNFLDPKIMGDSLNLSALIIWLALIYWGWVWGIAGALLAVPLTVTIKVICEYIPSLHWMGLIMGNSKNILQRQQPPPPKKPTGFKQKFFRNTQ